MIILLADPNAAAAGVSAHANTGNGNIVVRTHTLTGPGTDAGQLRRLGRRRGLLALIIASNVIRDGSRRPVPVVVLALTFWRWR